MPAKKKGAVFRVSGLPAQQSDGELDTALRAAITENLLDKEAEHSFTTAVVPSCNDDAQRVALVEFHDGVPDFLHELVVDPLKDWQIEMGDDDINFDRHFFGFTQLYTPDPSRPITADIIAITGLDGHAYGSWRSKGNLGRMWLRDFLSKDLPCCRTMIYGYNSKLSSHGISKIMDYGRELVEELKKIRSSEEARKRPLFFIAHSFGGIILAHCLIKAVQTNEDDHPTIAALHKATYGMLLFGIPHKGLVVDDIQNMLADANHPRSSLLQQISKESDLLASQLVDFKNLIRDRKIVSFYETGQTKKLEFNSEKRRWERTGDFVTAVDTDSALLQLPDSLEEKLPVDADHSMIVKFDNKNSKAYVSARDKLKQFEKDAPKVIAARFVLAINGPKPTIMIPFHQDPGFVGREGIITNIFGHHATDYHSRVALMGLGGVGKSQIAIEYAYRFRVSSPQTWVFWVHAANNSRFEEGYRAIADKVEMPGRDDPDTDILKAVHNWLADEMHRQWLIILDNVDEDGHFFNSERPLERFLPQTPNGKFLITSRNRTTAMNLVGSSSHIIQLDPMGETEALALLNTRVSLDESNKDDAKELVQALEYIPLAISHAAAYIKTSALMTMSDYLKRFEESEVHLVKMLGKTKYKDIRRDNSIRHAVIATWQISFAQIQDTEPSASDLLALMSMFDRHGIPITLLQEGSGEAVDLEQALTVLCDFSLIRMEVGKRSAGMHRLVQLSMKEWLKSDRQATTPTLQSRKVPNATPISEYYASWAFRALTIMSEAYPFADFAAFETRAICSEYLPHAYAVLVSVENVSMEDHVAKAHLLYNIGEYLHKEGRWREAEQHAHNSLILYTALSGTEYYNAIRSKDLLGRIFQQQGRWEEAERQFVESIQMGRMVLGELHATTLLTISNLSRLYYGLGRFDESKDLAVQAYEATLVAFGDDHPDTLDNAEHLALVYATQGRLKEAEELMFLSLRGFKKRYGESHPMTQEAMVYMGSIYQKQERWKEAEELTLQAVRCLEDARGEDSPRTLFATQNLVLILVGQERWAEAEILGTRALAALKSRMGEAHPDTLKGMNHLASIYEERGQLERGTELLTKVVQTSKEVLGEKHPDVLVRMNNLASKLGKLQRYEEATQLLVHAIEAGKTVFGVDSWYTLTFMFELAVIRRSCGKAGEAADLLRDIVEKQQSVLGPDHPDTLYSLSCLEECENEANNDVPTGPS